MPDSPSPTTSHEHGGALLPEQLVRGYKAFLGGRFQYEQDRLHHLGESGQTPRIMLIGCCDSRVSPDVIFDAGPGELFVVRNIANLVPPYGPNDDFHGTSAALEFGVMALEVEHIVILGHASCGGVSAYARGEEAGGRKPLSPGDFIGKWSRLIDAAAVLAGQIDAPVEDHVERLALASILQGLVNLRSFPWIAERERAGKLALHGAYFGIAKGSLLALDEARARFEPIAAGEHHAALSRSSG